LTEVARCLGVYKNNWNQVIWNSGLWSDGSFIIINILILTVRTYNTKLVWGCGASVSGRSIARSYSCKKSEKEDLTAVAVMSFFLNDVRSVSWSSHG
jgi:hypothetical protein